MLALIELLEQEGREFKRGFFRLGFGLLLSVAAVLSLIIGFFLLAWGMERWLSDLIGPVLSLVSMGASFLLLAGGLGIWIRRLILK